MKEKIKNKFLGINEVSDNKSKSIIILLIWVVFISFIVLISRNNIRNNNTQDIVFNNLSDIFSSYVNYDYIINIKDIDNNKVSYKGKVINNIDTGTRTINEDVLSYKIEDNIIYDSDNNEIDNLYMNYLSYFFKPSNLYDYLSYLKSEEKVDKNLKIYTYNYMYEDKEITFDITTTTDKIDEIIISYNDNIYSIKYN